MSQWKLESWIWLQERRLNKYVIKTIKIYILLYYACLLNRIFYNSYFKSYLQFGNIFFTWLPYSLISAALVLTLTFWDINLDFRTLYALLLKQWLVYKMSFLSRSNKTSGNWFSFLISTLFPQETDKK